MERKDKYDFLEEIGRVFDGENGAVDCRGRHIGGKYLINTEGCDFTGTVLYKCTPKLPNPEVFQIGVSQGSNPFSDIHLEYDMERAARFTNFTFDNIVASGTWKLYHVEINNSDVIDCDFSNALLHNCTFKYVVFENTYLMLSEFAYSHFRNCTLENVHLSSDSCEGYHTSFYSSTILNSKFEDLVFGEDFEFNTVNLENVEFVDCKFDGTEFYRTEFYDVKFTDCEYKNISFHGCTYRGNLEKELPIFYSIYEPDLKRIDGE